MFRKSAGAVSVALLGFSLLGSVAFAQDASPAADCVAGTPEENTQIVTDFFEAVLGGDLETADTLLADDFEHDLSSDGIEVPNEAGNADELTEEGLAILAESNHTIEATVAEGDWVAIEYLFDVPGSSVDGADPEAVATVEAMTFVRVECGAIAEARFEIDALGMMLQLGFEVTPPAAE